MVKEKKGIEREDGSEKDAREGGRKGGREKWEKMKDVRKNSKVDDKGQKKRM